MDLLCFLWNSKERGQITSTPQHLAQMVGMEWGRFEVVLNSLETKGICDVSRLRNGDVTLLSRRMSRESNALKLHALRSEKYRESNRLRQIRARSKVSDAVVTHEKSEVRSQNIYPIVPFEFETFWKTYPRKEAKHNALKAWNKIDFSVQGTKEKLLAGVAAWKETDQWKKGIIPHPATWLNQKRWEDEIKPKERVIG